MGDVVTWGVGVGVLSCFAYLFISNWVEIPSENGIIVFAKNACGLLQHWLSDLPENGKYDACLLWLIEHKSA